MTTRSGGLLHHYAALKIKARNPLGFRAFPLVAGAGFGPATFGL
jgi:hypothetical protein